MEELGLGLSDFSVFPDYANMTYVFLIEPMKEDTGVSTERLTECVFRHMCEANCKITGYVENGRLKKPAAHWLQPQTAMLYRDMMVYNGALANLQRGISILVD